MRAILLCYCFCSSAAEGLVGPDAGDDELQGLSIADFMTDNMRSLLKR